MADNPISPNASREVDVGPSAKWKDVKAEQIGANFRPVFGPKVSVVRAARGSPKDKIGIRRKQVNPKVFRTESYEFETSDRQHNKFVSGTSKHLFISMKPEFQVPEKTKSKPPVNANAEITPTEREKFVRTMGKSIKESVSFFMEDILPLSESIMSAISDVDEKLLQITEEKVALPVNFIARKVTLAAYLKITRHIVEKFNLTEREAHMMYEDLSKKEE